VDQRFRVDQLAFVAGMVRRTDTAVGSYYFNEEAATSTKKFIAARGCADMVLGEPRKRFMDVCEWRSSISGQPLALQMHV
jgi:hypothetical protein